MKRALIALLVVISFLQAGITFGTGSRVFIYNANIGVYGNLKNLGGVITPISTSKFSFVGATQDTITNIYTFPNLIINKPAGYLRLNNSTNNFALTGNVTFTQGNILTGTNTFELGASATVTGETATKYISGTVKAARAVGTGANTFGGIGYDLGSGTGDLGTVTVYRYTGDGSEVSIYGTEGIWRKWTVATSNAFSGTRTVTSSWLSNEDNGNNLTALKVWKYEPVKSTDGDTDISEFRKLILKKNDIAAAQSKGIEESESRESGETEEEVIDYEPSEEDSKTLYWVEVDGATFNTAASPRTATYTVNAATSFTVCSATNTFADGAGTEANPYQVATLAQLDNVRNYPTACFIQVANIDASATTGWNAGAGWDPIGSSTIYFTGKYNGQGYTINGLFINRIALNNIGLFGYVSGATISNVELTNVNISGASYTGGLVGYQTTSSSVINCMAQGSVTGGTYVGGLVGYVRVGSTISNSLTKGTVTANSYIGGLAGRIYSTCVISNCYSQSNVIRISGQTSLYVAGFTSQNYLSKINNCYSTGSVVYSGTTNPTDRGFVAYVTTGTGYEMANDFWNIETSGQTTNGAGTATGLTKTQMRTLLTFTNASWDFLGESVNGTSDIWGINAVLNSGYPFLSWEGITHRPSPFAGGIGTTDEPFLVSNLTQLDSVRGFLSYSFLQTADIDAAPTAGWNAGAGWLPIGTSSPYFTGSYDGDGHIISGLFYNRTSNYTGLFGVAFTGSVIKDLGLKEINANGYNYSGTIAAYCNGVINSCYATGSIRSYGYFGGIVGWVSSSGNISNCYSKVNVTRISGSADTNNAGFAGFAAGGSITKSYSTGSVTWENSSTTSKGFLGVYSSGTLSDNFWDKESSGQVTSATGATGKTTTEMRNVATYTLLGSAGLTNPWDFVGNPNNDVSNSDYWNIHTSLNSGYPYLNWEYRLAVEAPANLALVVSGTDVIITWDPVTNAAGYLVYSSVNPYGTFVLNETGSFNGTEWTGTLTGTRNFYYVTATNDTKVAPSKTIMINNLYMNK